MIHEVNKLIFNTLLEHGAVSIPNVGTLSILRTASRKKSGRVVAPLYDVVHSPNCTSPSISNIIISKGLVSQDVADDVVNRWLKKSMVDGRLTIEGIGTIVDGLYTPDPQLIAMLNIHNDSIVVRRNSARGWLITIIVVALCAAAAVAAYLYLYKADDRVVTESDTQLETTSHTPVITTENNEVVTPVEATDSLPSEPIQESVTESEPVVETPAEVDAETTIDESPVADGVNDWRYTSVRHYVIFGSYSVPANANKAVRKIMRRNPAAQCKIIQLGNMHAVAVYGSYNRSDCERFKRQYRSLYRDSWIHTPKRYR